MRVASLSLYLSLSATLSLTQTLHCPRALSLAGGAYIVNSIYAYKNYAKAHTQTTTDLAIIEAVDEKAWLRDYSTPQYYIRTSYRFLHSVLLFVVICIERRRIRCALVSFTCARACVCARARPRLGYDLSPPPTASRSLPTPSAIVLRIAKARSATLEVSRAVIASPGGSAFRARNAKMLAPRSLLSSVKCE